MRPTPPAPNPGVLEKILRTKREELPALRARRLPSPPPRRSLSLARDADGGLSVIAEIKRRSPSAGPLSRAMSVERRAAAYARAGAKMVSVLCDATYFDGAYEHLAQVRAACDLPVLCKEFVLDECQLDAARAYGADAVLLIVRCLEPTELDRLVQGARERDLVALVEVHSPDEVERARRAGATLVGVNARNLDTLEMHAAQAARVLAELPSEITRLHLSGIRDARQMAEVARGPADGVLIGECLMRQADPTPLLSELVAAARPGPADHRA